MRWSALLHKAMAPVAGLLLLASMVVGQGTAVADERGQHQDAVIAGYYPSWSSVPVSDIPVDRLTDILYAFVNIDDNGHCFLPNGSVDARNLAALAELKRQHPHVRVEASIGGWGAAGFSEASLTHQSRQNFVQSCMDLFFHQYGDVFDGVDLDWEFPVSGGPSNLTYRAEDRHNFTLLLGDFRRALDAVGRQRDEHLLLTAALPAGRLQSAGPYDPNESFELRNVGHILDFVNLMTYDLENGYSQLTGFNAPMRPDPTDPTPEIIKRWNTVATAVDYYEMHGVPAEKLVLGEPFFSEAFTTSSTDNDGLYQPVVERTSAPSWTTIKTELLNDPAWSYHRSRTAECPWLFNDSTKTFVTYDDPESLSVKSSFARDRHLRGVFTWALDQDDSEHSLLNAMSAPYLDAAGLG